VCSSDLFDNRYCLSLPINNKLFCNSFLNIVDTSELNKAEAKSRKLLLHRAVEASCNVVSE